MCLRTKKYQAHFFMMSDALPDRISLWEFCDGLADIRTEHDVSLDADDLLRELQDLHGNDTFASLVQDDTTCIKEPSTEPAHGNNMADLLQQHEHSLANHNYSQPEIWTAASPLITFTSDTSKTIKSSPTVSDGLIVKLPPMFKTKLDCPRQGGCAINTVISLPGGSICKGKSAIGSKHKFSCICGLKWQENNWRERERLEILGETEARCIQFLPTQPKRRRSKSTDRTG